QSDEIGYVYVRYGRVVINDPLMPNGIPHLCGILPPDEDDEPEQNPTPRVTKGYRGIRKGIDVRKAPKRKLKRLGRKMKKRAEMMADTSFAPHKVAKEQLKKKHQLLQLKVTRFSDRRSQPSKPPFTPLSRVKPSFSDTDVPRAQKSTPTLQQTPHTILSKLDAAPPRPINAVSTTVPQQATGAAPRQSSSTAVVPPQRSSPTADASLPLKDSNTSPAAPQSGTPQLSSHAVEAASQPVQQTTVAAPQKPASLASPPRPQSQTATVKPQQGTTLQSVRKRRTPSPPRNKTQMVLKRLQKSPLALKNLPR
ncbi:hypothetical protein AAVH_39342, partial [Aphelenchoides avenae]